MAEFIRRLHGGAAQRRDARLLAARYHADREGALPLSPTRADDLAGDLPVHGDVVECPEAVLQHRELALEPAQPLACPAAVEQVGEEIRRVAQFLDPDAQLVAPA